MVDGILDCTDFEGQCCALCHDEELGAELIRIMTDRAPKFETYAIVCCLKVGQAERRMRDNEVSNQSIPKGKL